MIQEYIQKSSDEACIDYICKTAQSLKKHYKSMQKSSEATFTTNKAYTWIRWGWRSTLEARHQSNCEWYERTKQELKEIILAFDRK